MSMFPSLTEFPRATIHVCSTESVGIELAGWGQVATGAGTWPVANLAMYIPMKIAYPITVAQMFWINGVVGTNSVDVGVYTSQGNRCLLYTSDAADE